MHIIINIINAYHSLFEQLKHYVNHYNIINKLELFRYNL